MFVEKRKRIRGKHEKVQHLSDHILKFYISVEKKRKEKKEGN